MSEFPRVPSVRPRDAIRPLQPVRRPNAKKRREADDEREERDPDEDPVATDNTPSSGEESGRISLRV